MKYKFHKNLKRDPILLYDINEVLSFDVFTSNSENLISKAVNIYLHL